MIKSHIECDFPKCKKSQTEIKEGIGFNGWGHVRGFRLDGETRDLHLCPEHLQTLSNWLKEKNNGMD